MFNSVLSTFISSPRMISRLGSVVNRVGIVSHLRLIHFAPRENVRFKDSVPATTQSSAGSQDILLQHMRSAKESTDVLNTINRHHSIMNSKHAVQALRSLFALQKAHSSRISNGEIVNSKDFRKLCEIMKSQIRHIELNDLIDMLKCLGYLGVPANSKIMSVTLGLISKQVNDLSLQQIVFLDFIMRDMKPVPIIKALQIALPIVFEANLQTRCDFSNTAQVSDLFCFVTKRVHMKNSSDLIVDALIDKREELTLKDARNIVHAMCDTRLFNDKYKLLLHHALDVVTDEIYRLDYYDMESLLSRLCIKHTDHIGDPSFYHEEFCNACVRQVLERDYTFEQNLWILKKILRFNHTHLDFLTHLAVKVEKEPWVLEQVGATGLISFISGYSQADFKPDNWLRIKPLVIKAVQNLLDRTELPWLKLVLHLCVTECWSEEVLKHVFDRQFLTTFMSREYNKLDRITLLTLDQVCATLAPWPIRPRAPTDLIAPIVQMNGAHITSYPLEPLLVQGLGGSQYVANGVITPLGHFLDHLVVMRKGGYSVAINQPTEHPEENKERLTTEDIQSGLPSDSKMIAVIFVPATMCAVNSERVKGMMRIQINSIEALGISVAPILQPVWHTLPDFEKIPYLMRAIRLKLPDSEATSVVTPV